MVRDDIELVSIYCRVSTNDQDCERQVQDLTAYAQRMGWTIIGEPYKEKVSGMQTDRKERAKIIQLARQGRIHAVLVTELSRWGRSTSDVMETVKQLSAYGVSLIAQTGIDFNLATPQGKLMLTLMSGLAEFERDLTRERIVSGLAAARARGKTLGRLPGDTPVQDKIRKQVLKHTAEGRSVTWIAKELQVSRTTVQKIRSLNSA